MVGVDDRVDPKVLIVDQLLVFSCELHCKLTTGRFFGTKLTDVGFGHINHFVVNVISDGGFGNVIYVAGDVLHDLITVCDIGLDGDWGFWGPESPQLLWRRLLNLDVCGADVLLHVINLTATFGGGLGDSLGSRHNGNVGLGGRQIRGIVTSVAGHAGVGLLGVGGLGVSRLTTLEVDGSSRTLGTIATLISVGLRVLARPAMPELHVLVDAPVWFTFTLVTRTALDGACFCVGWQNVRFCLPRDDLDCVEVFSVPTTLASVVDGIVCVCFV